MSRQLVALLALVLATLGLVSLPPADVQEVDGRLAERLPASEEGWRTIEPHGADTLPADPRALETARQTYVKDGRVVTLAVARYPSRNHPDHRPLPDFIMTAPASVRVTEGTPLPLYRADGLAVPLVVLQRHDRRVSVAHWYQVGGEPILGEYTLRYRRFVDTLLSRPQPLLLIRLAGDDRAALAEFLKSFYPRLRSILVS
jgi:EpsI family protein